MFRYTVQLFGVTLFALAVIWFAGSGEALQISSAAEPVLWADTFQIEVDDGQPTNEVTPQDDRDTFFRNIKKLDRAAAYIQNQYMEDIDASEMIKAGIRGMLSNLDRFSVLMEKQSYDALMESTHGKYEGLGMQIDARDNYITIITPIEGTPAYHKGLRAGDIIYEIDGTSTEGMKSADAAKLMRGDAGTSVKLMVRRAGIADLMEFEVDRAVIELKSVNYYGVIPGTDVGYVRLSRFAEETSHELRDGISYLNEQNISGMIFDLRNNGGGLLDQAKETAELFLKEGREIVYTRGRYEDSERHYRSERPPLYPDKPLIILVDEGTASASEIVAGAVQDWDRGLVMGTTTYGKGLVQQLFKISNDDAHIKLTTAKYYVPSGRCIQKPEKQSKKAPPHDDFTGEEETTDTLTVADKEVYYTNGGRIVYGGGGIIPDIEVEREMWKPIEINLVRNSMFFDYAIKFVADHPDVTSDVEITDDIVEDFRKFLKEKNFDYKTTLQVELDKLKELVASEEKNETFAQPIEQLEALIESEKYADFNKSLDYIKRTIKREIVASIAGERGVYEKIVMAYDPAVLNAIEILTTPERYSQLILADQKKAQLD